MAKGTCTEPGCTTIARMRGLCARHYQQRKAAGTLPPLPPPVRHQLTPQLCACGCGEYAAVDTRRNRVAKYVSGHNARVAHPRGGLKHGMEGTATYNSWSSMLNRCRNPNSPDYKNWGARGIRVCERWQGPNGFANFLADLGPRPEGRTLDRIDNDGNYEPGNCRWASWHQQATNRRPPTQPGGGV